MKHLLQIQPTNSREAAVLDLLRAWDYQISADSVAASIYHVCQLNALRTIFARHLGDHTDAYIGIDITGLADFSLYQGRTSVRLLDMLDNPRATRSGCATPKAASPKRRAKRCTGHCASPCSG